MNYKAVIFDMDGLMFDTERLSCRMWEKAAAEKGYTISDSIFQEIIGSNVIETEKIFKKKYGQDFPYLDLRKIRLHYTDLYLAKEGIPVKEGLYHLLSFLNKKRIKKAVATSTEKARASGIISRAGLSNNFDIIVGGDDVRRSKPEPDIFIETARQLNTAPEKCIVLEDSEKGIHAAIAAHMFPIMIPDLKGPSIFIRKKGIHICKTLEDVVKILENIV